MTGELDQFTCGHDVLAGLARPFGSSHRLFGEVESSVLALVLGMQFVEFGDVLRPRMVCGLDAFE